MLYSKSTGGFYDCTINTDIPSDALEIKDKLYQECLEGQAKGRSILADSNGLPVSAEPVLPNLRQLSDMMITQAREQRKQIMNVLDGMQSSALSREDMASATAIETAKQGLRDITKADLSGCLTTSDIEDAIMKRYQSIASALPVKLRLAFSGVTA